jgi:hypothetical protein
MTPRGGAEPARVFYGGWAALAFALIIFLSPVPSPLAARPDVRPVAGGR